MNVAAVGGKEQNHDASEMPNVYTYPCAACFL